MRKGSTAGGIARVIGHILLILLVTILLFVVFLYGVMGVLTHGPSSEAKRLFVLSCNETSAMKFVPHLVLSDSQVEAILNPTETAETETETETTETASDFTELPYEDGRTVEEETSSGQVVVAEPTETTTESGEWLEVIDIKGSTFKGKMMIIHDPSKVVVGTLDAYGDNYHGLYLYEFIEKYGAIAGTNAGGFYDPNGGGNGGIPDGLVISDGQIAYGSAGTWYQNVVGFDADHILHVGDMTAQQALDLGIQSAVSFSPGPVLVKDGELQTNLGGGMNPRTCIGQCSDGTILLMVIEGRKPDSMGATYDDIAKIMYEYGAVNAANLDGGSSSLMYYNGEQITRGSNIVGMRQMSTAILVLN